MVAKHLSLCLGRKWGLKIQDCNLLLKKKSLILWIHSQHFTFHVVPGRDVPAVGVSLNLHMEMERSTVMGWSDG